MRRQIIFFISRNQFFQLKLLLVFVQSTSVGVLLMFAQRFVMKYVVKGLSWNLSLHEIFWVDRIDMLAFCAFYVLA